MVPITPHLDSKRFGPWALVTGASSGIGKEFAQKLAASGFHLALASRRVDELEKLGRRLQQEHGTQFRAIGIDLAQPNAAAALEASLRELDVGLVISNAGDAVPGPFLSVPLADLHAMVSINVLATLDVARLFGPRLAARGHGGLVLVGALGASEGVPFMANAAATKAYVVSLGKALHVELAKQGITVTTLIPGPTATAALDKLGIENPPMKPMGVEQCVSETLHALGAGHATIVPGRLVRFLSALVPSSLLRNQTAKMFEASLKAKEAAIERS